MDRDIKQDAAQHIDSSKKLIANAEKIMTQMATLRKKLHLNDGCGQRYLQKTHPDQALLEQAEKEITTFFDKFGPVKKTIVIKLLEMAIDQCGTHRHISYYLEIIQGGM